ncbi:acetyl-CoA C-acetyltransferase [Lactobacillus sp. CC-MHH1034]|uniref:acetyl-CoA C-acetyltransferase n=1 Tax=Agrilactobacillus fermenti TaxID=2586909 RepID=UPI001E621FEF|nr:acetyl-CoA C-acetyltransferase [Agrilactobacillus fermenti]MCD2255176.1 acetyl-CoA C-acetyltransferase [Agrilactobacillus fermenti]
MDKVVIAGAKRTPIGKLGGQFAQLSAVDLGTAAAKAAVASSGIDADLIDQAIFGNVLQAGSGQNVARQIALNTGMSVTSTAMTINEVCGSGLKAVRLGQAAIAMGDAEVVLVGGTESMSQAPFLANIRFGQTIGNAPLVDSMVHDGLTDSFSHKHMGLTAENVAETFHIDRETQDAFAAESQHKAATATAAGWFDGEITPVTVYDRKGRAQTITKDEGIRPDTTPEILAHLKPSFKANGTVTAGNASGINDGASALILMSERKAKALGIPYLATIDDFVEVGIDPAIMGYSPVMAIEKLLQKQADQPEDIDLYEINEAFASQSVAVARDLKLPSDRINVAGGAIALGHPIGASGARILTTLLYQLKRTNQITGLAALCVGGGLGVAMKVSRNEG